ncbi:hypothetical protein C8J56DRAFT_67968 [Mycena floridula]|nr:hypothetical protein C8J56DRAFT_67968 [Mycena floridula]
MDASRPLDVQFRHEPSVAYVEQQPQNQCRVDLRHQHQVSLRQNQQLKHAEQNSRPPGQFEWMQQEQPAHYRHYRQQAQFQGQFQRQQQYPHYDPQVSQSRPDSFSLHSSTFLPAQASQREHSLYPVSTSHHASMSWSPNHPVSSSSDVVAFDGYWPNSGQISRPSSSQISRPASSQISQPSSSQISRSSSSQLHQNPFACSPASRAQVQARPHPTSLLNNDQTLHSNSGSRHALISTSRGPSAPASKAPSASASISRPNVDWSAHGGYPAMQMALAAERFVGDPGNIVKSRIQVERKRSIDEESKKRYIDDGDATKPSKRRRLTLDCYPSPPASALESNSKIPSFSSNGAQPSSTAIHQSTNSALASSIQYPFPVHYTRYPLSPPVSPLDAIVSPSPRAAPVEDTGSDEELQLEYPPSPPNTSGELTHPASSTSRAAQAQPSSISRARPSTAPFQQPFTALHLSRPYHQTIPNLHQGIPNQNLHQTTTPNLYNPNIFPLRDSNVHGQNIDIHSLQNPSLYPVQNPNSNTPTVHSNHYAKSRTLPKGLWQSSWMDPMGLKGSTNGLEKGLVRGSETGPTAKEQELEKELVENGKAEATKKPQMDFSKIRRVRLILPDPPRGWKDKSQRLEEIELQQSQSSSQGESKPQHESELRISTHQAQSQQGSLAPSALSPSRPESLSYLLACQSHLPQSHSQQSPLHIPHYQSQKLQPLLDEAPVQPFISPRSPSPSEPQHQSSLQSSAGTASFQPESSPQPESQILPSVFQQSQSSSHEAQVDASISPTRQSQQASIQISLQAPSQISQSQSPKSQLQSQSSPEESQAQLLVEPESHLPSVQPASQLPALPYSSRLSRIAEHRRLLLARQSSLVPQPESIPAAQPTPNPASQRETVSTSTFQSIPASQNNEPISVVSSSSSRESISVASRLEPVLPVRRESASDSPLDSTLLSPPHDAPKPREQGEAWTAQEEAEGSEYREQAMDLRHWDEEKHLGSREKGDDSESESRSDIDYSDSESESGSDESVYEDDWMSESSGAPGSSPKARRRRRSSPGQEGRKTLGREEDRKSLGGEDEDLVGDGAEEDEYCYRLATSGRFRCMVPRCESSFPDRPRAKRHARNSHGLGDGPDIYCPIRPCTGRLRTKEAVKTHCQDHHPGKWKDSLLLKHVVPINPYVKNAPVFSQNKRRVPNDERDEEESDEDVDSSKAGSAPDGDAFKDESDQDAFEDEIDEGKKSCYRRSAGGAFYCTVPQCKGGPFRDQYNAKRHARNIHGLGGKSFF